MASRRRRGARRGGSPALIVGLALATVALLAALHRAEKAPSPPTSRAEGRPAPAERRVADGGEATRPASRRDDGSPASGDQAGGGAERPSVVGVSPAAAVPVPVEAKGRRDSGPARVAVVIDDCGNDLALMRQAVASSVPLTFAVLPHLRYSRESAELAFSHGHEVILHQPMEAEDTAWDSGHGTLRLGMGGAEVRRLIAENLATVPHAAGLNNHMGSRATADPRLMGEVVSAVARIGEEVPGFYFLDSRTTARTVAHAAARRRGVPSLTRSAAFLDNEPDAESVRERVEELVRTALEEGEAVGIGHLKPETLGVLQAILPGVSPARVRFVYASELAR